MVSLLRSILLLLLPVIACAADSARTRIAIMPATLQKQARGYDSALKESQTLAELVQFALQADPATASAEFVERGEIDVILREQTLALDGSAASTVHAGRLSHADWILRIRLRADELARPGVEVEVIDSLRADLLARVRADLETLPDESWLLRPSPESVRLVTDLAARALTEARSRHADLSRLTALAPLTFLNLTGTDRLAPFAAKLHAALRATPHGTARALGFDDADTPLAESLLTHTGLTDLDPQTFARVADAYLWGEFREDTTHVGAAADTPVFLRLSLWREGDTPRILELTGQLGSLDNLARDAALATLNAASGARLHPSASARRAAADRLLEAARALGEVTDTTASARRARQEHITRLTGLAAFFAPEDTPLVERHITLRRRLASSGAEQRRWTRAFWHHFDRHLVMPDGRPDLALIARAAGHDAAVPGLGPRFARIGAAWLGNAIDEPAALSLWKNFAQAINQLPDEPGLPAAIEALWPTVSRLDPALDPTAPSSDYGLRNTLAKVYRSDPARARELLAGRLIPAAPRATPAPAASPPSSQPTATAASPRSEPQTKPRATASPAGVLSPPWDQFPPEVLVERVNQGPLVSAPALQAHALEFTPFQLPQSPPTARPLAATTAFINTLATDGTALWFAFARVGQDRGDTRRRATRVPLASPALEWPSALVDGETEIADLWLESPNEVWLATRGEGLRVFDPASGAFQDLRAASGLPLDSVRGIARGHQALFIGHDSQSADTTIPRVDLRDRALSQVAPNASPDLALLPPATRAAITSYPDDSPPTVRLPAQSALGWSVARHAPAFDRSTPAATATFYPASVLLPASASPDSDTSVARLACLTGARDGYWIAGLQGVAWASGTRRIPLAHWLRGHIFALADDGRRLFVLVVDRPPREFLYSPSETPSSDSARLYAYDHQEGRWLGWLPLPRHGALVAGHGRLVFFFAAHTPVLVYETNALRPATVVATAASTAAPASGTVQRSPSVPLHSRQPSDARALHSAASAGDFTRFEALLPLASIEELDRPFPDRGDRIPLGLATLQALLKKSRPDLAHRLLDRGIATPLGKWDHWAVTDPIFMLAVRCGDADLVARLRRLGYGPPDSSSANPLHEAITRKNAPLLRALLAREPRADATAESSGGQLVKIDPDLANSDGRTPLFAAADVGWTEGVRLLVEAGARSLHGDHATGRSLRDAAAPWPEIAVLLNRRPDSPDNHLDGARAIAAIHRGDALADLVLTPATLRYRDFWDWTVLHHAARHGQADLVHRLLLAGAEPDTLTSFGESALCLAVYHGDLATVSRLLEAGADPNHHRGLGWLPLHVAVNTGRPALVRLLLTARADPRLVVGKVASPTLVLASASRDDEQSLRLLLEAGAPLHLTDTDGFGPLEAAVISDSPSKIQYLLDRGARWQKPSGPDYHPMDAAAKRGLLRSLRKLQDLGLQSPRALAHAKDDATRALLQDDTSPAGRLRLLNEQQWRVVMAEPDPARRHEHVLAHLAAGADPSHLSADWGTPLDLAIATRDIALVRLLVEHGANPAVKSKGIAGNVYRPRTSLQAWLGGQSSLRNRGERPTPTADEFALACLPIFWPHEPDPELRQEMIAWAESADLPRSAAWMHAHIHD